MKNTVIIKSFQNGISVYLNEDIPFPELLEEVIFKFRESRNFFKNAKMAISLEGRSLSDEEERIILNAICDNSDLHIVCLVGKDEEKNQNYLKAIQQLEYRNSQEDNDGHFYRGTLKTGKYWKPSPALLFWGISIPAARSYPQKISLYLAGFLEKHMPEGTAAKGIL